MTLFLLYLWLKLDTFHDLLSGLTGACVVVSVLTIVTCLINIDNADESWHKMLRRIPKWLIPLGIFFIFVNVALPTQKQGAYLIAGYAGLKLTETPEMGKLTELVRLKVGNYLDDELKSAKAQAMGAVASAVSK